MDKHLTPSGRPLLETENLVKIYGAGPTRFDALKGITLQIEEGQTVAITGKSGSGKSTLMHLLAMLDAPTSGVVALNGTPSSQLSPKQLARVRNQYFGFVFQQFFLTPSATVLDNVTLPLKIAGVSRKERNETGMNWLTAVDLEDKARSKAVDLSGGQKQRASIARALVMEPKILFADEPTGNLDTENSAIVEEILFGLNDELGITLVMVTHDEDLANKCQRRLVMQDGMLTNPQDAMVQA